MGSNCASGLKCLQRNAKEAVPGCKAGGAGDVNTYDYCYKLPAGSTTLVDFGVSAHTMGRLNMCQGDCDANSNCASGLRCFQRNGKQPVPGCNAGGVNGWDYCYNPGSTTMLNLGVSAHGLGKLNVCQGDCDADSNCASGLKCFQRNGKQAVPGCKAGGSGDVSTYDYCIKR